MINATDLRYIHHEEKQLRENVPSRNEMKIC